MISYAAKGKVKSVSKARFSNRVFMRQDTTSQFVAPFDTDTACPTQGERYCRWLVVLRTIPGNLERAGLPAQPAALQKLHIDRGSQGRREPMRFA